MLANSNNPQQNQDLPLDDLRTENDILKLKMMAEAGAVFGGGEGLTPEMEHQFLQQIYTFEKNYASGSSTSFEETVGKPSLIPFEELDNTAEDFVDALVQDALDFYKSKHIDVNFHFDYPAETRYRFLVEELPGHANHFGQEPGMMVGVLYEEYHPNHGGSIESGTIDFMEGLRELNVEQMKMSLSPVQFLPDGPYPTQVLIDALEEKFENIISLDDFEYMVLETSYDLSITETAKEEEVGMGYTEGLVKFVVKKKNGEEKPIGGPFKFYFHYEYGMWSIMYMVFPGIKYPPIPDDYGDHSDG